MAVWSLWPLQRPRCHIISAACILCDAGPRSQHGQPHPDWSQYTAGATSRLPSLNNLPLATWRCNGRPLILEKTLQHNWKTPTVLLWADLGCWGGGATAKQRKAIGAQQRVRHHTKGTITFKFFFWFRGRFCSDGNTKNVASGKLKAPAERLQTSGADSAAVRWSIISGRLSRKTGPA